MCKSEQPPLGLAVYLPAPMTVRPDWLVLWSTPSGLRCSLIRHECAPAFEVVISRGSETLYRLAFECEADAVAFVNDSAGLAMAEMRPGGPGNASRSAVPRRL